MHGVSTAAMVIAVVAIAAITNLPADPKQGFIQQNVTRRRKKEPRRI